MKLKLATLLLTSGMAFNCLAAAGESTASLNFAHANGKIKHKGNGETFSDEQGMNGVNTSYRYEFDDIFGVMGSATWLFNTSKEIEKKDALESSKKESVNYLSLSVGPTFRINEHVSLYTLLGYAQNQTRIDYQNRAEKDVKIKFGGLTWGAGLQINPVNNLAVNIGYEGANMKYKGDEKNVPNMKSHGLNIGLGYKF